MPKELVRHPHAQLIIPALIADLPAAVKLAAVLLALRPAAATS